MVPKTLDSALWLPLPYLLKTMQVSTQEVTPPLRRMLVDPPGITRLVGRIHGVFEWLCPVCSGMNRTWVDNRVPHVQCCMTACRRTFGIGLVGHAQQPAALPPFNGLLHHVHVHTDYVQHAARGKEPIVSHYYNRLRPEIVTCSPAILRIAGTVEWTCQACSRDNIDYPDWTTGKLHCAYCPQAWFASGALLAAHAGLRQYPADWSGLRTAKGKLTKHAMRASRNLRLRRTLPSTTLCSAR